MMTCPFYQTVADQIPWETDNQRGCLVGWAVERGVWPMNWPGKAIHGIGIDQDEEKVKLSKTLAKTAHGP
jgi:hypothetical protein